MDRDTRRTAIAVAAALLTPPVLVALLSRLLFSAPVLPDVLPDQAPSPDLSVGTLIDLSQTLLSMSVGLAAAAIWLYREPLRQVADGLRMVVAGLGLLAALTSIYAGLRFQFDVAKQVLAMPLAFDLVANRLYWQGGALLFQLSLACAGAVLHLLHRDRRYRRDG